MEENNLSENSLNEKLKEEKQMEDAKTEASNIKQKILNSLQREGYVVLSFSGPIEEISLGGQIGAENVFAVKVEDKKSKIETFIFDKEGQQIATINEQNRIILQQDFLEKFKKFTGEPGKQSPIQQGYYGFQENYLSEEEMDDLWVQVEEKEMPEENTEKTRNEKIAHALGVSVDDILTVVEVKEQDTKTVITDKDNKYSEIYAVELRRDSAGRGDHDWVAVEAMADRNNAKRSGT